VGTLAQVACGFISATQAAEAGRMIAADPEAVILLDKVFGGRPSFMSDWF